MRLFQFLGFGICLMTLGTFGMAQTPEKPREKVIIDTDIGDDIDDAFAVALALKSPELDILGFTTTFGDTALRADLLDRLLSEADAQQIPVAVGKPTKGTTSFTQAAFANRGAALHKEHQDAVDFTLQAIRRAPHEITLVAIGPLVNVGAMLEKDPATFSLLKRVVIMGGSIESFTPESEPDKPVPPIAEWNIVNDISSAQRLFNSGVPIVMMPLDSTAELQLDEVKRATIFRQGTHLTGALSALYFEWGSPTPTLFDPMTIAYILRPEICPAIPMRIRVDDKGFTRKDDGDPNAMVCIHSDKEEFFRFYIGRLIADSAFLVTSR